MLITFFKTAWRNIVRDKVYSGIEFIGTGDRDGCRITHRALGSLSALL